MGCPVCTGVLPFCDCTEMDRIRATLAASEREAERLRHGAPVEGDYVCPDALEVVKLRAEVERLRDDAGRDRALVAAIVEEHVAPLKAEVERCRDLLVAMVAQHCQVGDLGSHLDNWCMSTNADAIRYLAEIGRVEIISEAGRRVVARWTK